MDDYVPSKRDDYPSKGRDDYKRDSYKGRDDYKREIDIPPRHSGLLGRQLKFCVQ